MTDRNTHLELYTSPAISLADNLELHNATHAVEYMLYRIPRLIRTVRQATGDTTKIDALKQAIDMAVELYYSAADTYVRRTVAAFSITKSACSSSIAVLMKEHIFDFPCVQSYTLTLQYYLFRIVLCGILQTLCHTHASMIPIDLAQIQAADIEAATSIAMCTDYGLQAHASSPLVALKMIIPLQIGFGTWRRLRLRQSSSVTVDYLYAEQMEWWHINTANVFDDLWHSVKTDYYRMSVIVDTWAGGPMAPWMIACRTPGFA